MSMWETFIFGEKLTRSICLFWEYIESTGYLGPSIGNANLTIPPPPQISSTLSLPYFPISSFLLLPNDHAVQLVHCTEARDHFLLTIPPHPLLPSSSYSQLIGPGSYYTFLSNYLNILL